MPPAFMKIKPTDEQNKVIAESETNASQLPTQSSHTADAVLPAFRLKKLLVPVDFSACSRKALHYAISLARQFGAELTVLHVVQAYPPMPEMGPVDVESVQDAHEELAVLQETIGHAIASKTMVRTGTAYAEIINAAKELDIDLVVLSTHGRTGLVHVLLGSTAEKVARHAGCPVLIVREHERDFVV